MQASPQMPLQKLFGIHTDAVPNVEPQITLGVLFDHHKRQADFYAERILASSEEETIIHATDAYAFHRATTKKIAEVMDFLHRLCIAAD